MSDCSEKKDKRGNVITKAMADMERLKGFYWEERLALGLGLGLGLGIGLGLRIEVGLGLGLWFQSYQN
jgi:hypothetical protein